VKTIARYSGGKRWQHATGAQALSPCSGLFGHMFLLRLKSTERHTPCFQFFTLTSHVVLV